MITVVSPAKTLDYESELPTARFSQADFLEHSQTLIEEARLLSPDEIAKMMKISEKLSLLNHQRFADWSQPLTPENARPAVLAFKGDVYTGLDAANFSDVDYDFAQDNFRILSGLYGLLRPLDLMQAYRLEMGTGFKNSRGKNLYEFWGEVPTQALNELCAKQGTDVLVNLASNEYFKVIKKKSLKARIVTPVFKDTKNGKLKIISFYAKKARGMMAAYIIQNRLSSVEDLKAFDVAGYAYNEELSVKEDELVFTRAEQ